MLVGSAFPLVGAWTQQHRAIMSSRSLQSRSEAGPTWSQRYVAHTVLDD